MDGKMKRGRKKVGEKEEGEAEGERKWWGGGDVVEGEGKGLGERWS